MVGLDTKNETASTTPDEAMINDILKNLGLSKDVLATLPTEVQATVKRGILQISKLDENGKSMEREDMERVGKRAEFSRIAEMNNAEIQRGYHEGNKDWRAVATQNLVDAARETNPQRQSNLKAGVEQPAQQYLGRLSNAGKDYAEILGSTPSATDVMSYLSQRNTQMDNLRGSLFELTKTLHAIPLAKAAPVVV